MHRNCRSVGLTCVRFVDGSLSADWKFDVRTPSGIGSRTLWAVWVVAGPYRFLTAWATHEFGTHQIFKLLHLRPKLLSLNRCHVSKYLVWTWRHCSCSGMAPCLSQTGVVCRNSKGCNFVTVSQGSEKRWDVN